MTKTKRTKKMKEMNPPISHHTNSVIKIAAPMIPQPSLARMGYEEFDFKPFLLNRLFFGKEKADGPPLLTAYFRQISLD